MHRDRPTPTFAHPAEEEFARLLDYYGVPWEYEPHQFALARNTDGDLKAAFAPDFFLPKEGRYVELTTMNARGISRKHRKMRQMRQSYPQVRVQLWGRRQLHSLMAKYGIPPDAIAANE
jgi:hypoxanthine phosphoribosyltransferase